MTRWMRLAGLLLAMALAAAACGGGGGDEAEASDDHDHAEHDHDDHSHDHSHGEDGEEVEEVEEDDPADLPSEVEAEADDGRRIRLAMGRECVTPGGEQSFTVEAWPEARLLYQAVYDGDRHGATADYPGGNDRGETDAGGRYESSWVVGEGAPAGPASFQVLVVGHAEPVVAGFDVAEECGA